MREILDDPKAFFDNLSTEEFDNLLSEFGFEYEIKNIEEKYFNYSNLTTTKNSNFKNFTKFHCGNVNNYNKMIENIKINDIFVDKFIENKGSASEYVVNEFDNDFIKAA